VNLHATCSSWPATLPAKLVLLAAASQQHSLPGVFLMFLFCCYDACLHYSLCRFVEAVALMNRQLSQQGVATKKLPLLHKAALAAAKAAIPAQRIHQVLNGAQWTEAGAVQGKNLNPAGMGGPGESGRQPHSSVGGSSSSDAGFGHVQLEPGADEAYDAAAEDVQQQQAEFGQAVAAALAAYSSSQGKGSATAARGFSAHQLQRGASSGTAVQRAFLDEAQQGVVCLVVRPPAGAIAGTHEMFPSHGHFQQQQQHEQRLGGAWVQQLLVPGHVLLKQEPLAGSEVAAAAGLNATAAAGGSRGKGRGRGGRGKGRTAAVAAAGVCDEHEGLLLLHVEVPELASLARELQQAQQQLAAAAAAAVGRATAAFFGSYSMFKAMVAAAAELDVLAGFASIAGDAAPGSYSRPRFAAAGSAQAAAAAGGSSSTGTAAGSSGGSSPVLQFVGLWHPLMGQSVVGGSSSVVPNDVQLGGDRPTAMLLTGEWVVACRHLGVQKMVTAGRDKQQTSGLCLASRQCLWAAQKAMSASSSQLAHCHVLAILLLPATVLC
jgi:hypothetical protein